MRRQEPALATGRTGKALPGYHGATIDAAEASMHRRTFGLGTENSYAIEPTTAFSSRSRRQSTGSGVGKLYESYRSAAKATGCSTFIVPMFILQCGGGPYWLSIGSEKTSPGIPMHATRSSTYNALAPQTQAHSLSNRHIRGQVSQVTGVFRYIDVQLTAPSALST